jgi:hypothetical protein
VSKFLRTAAVVEPADICTRLILALSAVVLLVQVVRASKLRIMKFLGASYAWLDNRQTRGHPLHAGKRLAQKLPAANQDSERDS